MLRLLVLTAAVLVVVIVGLDAASAVDLSLVPWADVDTPDFYGDYSYPDYWVDYGAVNPSDYESSSSDWDEWIPDAE